MNPVPPPAAASPAVVSQRLMSLDALRGFDMFWIMGGDAIGQALDKMVHSDSGVVHFVATQLDHVPWTGFHFYDMIFPLFVFIVGVSLVFSLTKIIEREGREAATIRIVRRGLLLWVIGVLYYGGWSKGIDGIRLLGVLQRIGLCYLFAGLFFVYLKPRGLLISLVSLLVGYWAMLSFIPVPGIEQLGFSDPARFAEGRNLTNWIDAHYLPFFKWDGDHDPEGLLSTLPAIASCLLGVFAGLLLRDGRWTPTRKTQILLGAGVASIVLGCLWGLQFPIIKKIWTSSYVLLVGGGSAILLGIFYWVIDVKGFKWWAQPFVWVGLNPITIYLIGNLVDLDKVATRVLGGPVKDFADGIASGFGGVIISVGGTLLGVLVCWFLHRRKLYLRL
jgi:predicted acyltransferase